MPYKIPLTIIFFFFSTFLLLFSINADDMFDDTGHDQVIAKKMNSILRNDDLEFRLVDQFGTPHSLNDFSKLKKIHFIAFDLNCPKDIYPKEIKKNYLFINTNLETSRESLMTLFPKQIILMDELFLVSSSLGFKSCGDVFQYDFKNERLKFLKNLNPKLARAIVFNSNPQLNFEKDVLPTIESSCLKCHVGNSSLNFFNGVRKIKAWRKMMLRTMRLGRMPPGADTYYFSDHYSYNKKDLLTLSRWLDNLEGISENDLAKLAEVYKKHLENLRVQRFSTIEKQISQMEKIISYPDETIAADGAPFYKYYTTNEPTQNDIFFDKFFVKINSDVGHHMALHFSKKPFPKIKLDGSPLNQNEFMQLYGNNPEPTPGSVNGKKVSAYKFDDPNIIHVVRNQGYQMAYPNSTYYIPKGSYLNLEIHFNPTGKKELTPIELSLLKDESLKDKPVIRRFSMTPNDHTIIARPNEFKSLVEMSYVLPNDIEFVGYGLHMHYRGQSGILFYEEPNQKKKILMSFPTYQYKNQLSSFFNKPIKLLKGTKLINQIIYNNSDLNLSNPNPKKSVKIGTSILEDENYLPRIYFLEHRK